MSARKTFLCIHAYVYVFLLENGFGIYGDLPKPFPCIVKTNIWKKERVEVFFWISRWTNNEHSQKILRQNIPGNHWPEFKDEYS